MMLRARAMEGIAGRCGEGIAERFGSYSGTRPEKKLEDCFARLQIIPHADIDKHLLFAL